MHSYRLSKSWNDLWLTHCKSIKRITDIDSTFTAHFFKWKALFYLSCFSLVGAQEVPATNKVLRESL